MTYLFSALSSEVVENWRSGEVDANGQVPERVVSDGSGNPCRYCLGEIPAGRGMLILAHRPFDDLNPYSEVGPIFLCDNCDRYSDAVNVPPVLSNRTRHLFKGYGSDDRIVYGTGEIVETVDIPAYLAKTFERGDVRYVHARSVTNNCFTLRVEQS